MDQFGDMVDLYDFAGQGKYVAVDVSAIWCPPCNSLAGFIDDGDPNAGWGLAPEMVHNGDIYWLTILGENNLSHSDSRKPSRLVRRLPR